MNTCFLNLKVFLVLHFCLGRQYPAVPEVSVKRLFSADDSLHWFQAISQFCCFWHVTEDLHVHHLCFMLRRRSKSCIMLVSQVTGRCAGDVLCHDSRHKIDDSHKEFSDHIEAVIDTLWCPKLIECCVTIIFLALIPHILGLIPGLFCVGFLVNTVAMGQAFLRVLGLFYCVPDASLSTNVNSVLR